MATKAEEIRNAATTQLETAPTAEVSEMQMLQNMIAAQAQLIADLQVQNAMLAPVKAGPVVEKVYFNSVPFCNVHIMRSPGHAEPVQFIGGQLHTADPIVQAALDAICDKPGSTVTSNNSNPQAAQNAAMRADIANLAAIAHKKAVDAGLSTA